MEMKPGYKQSEVGIIPEDWIVRKLIDCLLDAPDYGINAPAVVYSDNLPVYIRITDIDEDGRYTPEQIVSVKQTGSEKYYLRENELVFARTGASVGKSYLYNPKDGDLVFAGFLIRVRPNPSLLCPHFLSALVTTGFYWNWVRLMSMRSGQPGINSVEYGQLPIPLPLLPEQRAIAAALSDTDALLSSLDRLLAKKRDIKQAVMQQLLAGKQRLPGFIGDWTDHLLGELGIFKKGKGIKKDEVVPDGIPCIRYGELYTRHNDYVKTFHSFIPCSIANNSQQLKKGDLLFAGSGETSEEIGKCVAFLSDDEAYAGGDIVIFSPVKQDSLYLGYLMNQPNIVAQKSRMGQGDAVVHIGAVSLAQLQICLPPLSEQTAIAAVLSDMDAEIDALQQRRDKTRAIKQGMMQELLTGKTRLV